MTMSRNTAHVLLQCQQLLEIISPTNSRRLRSKPILLNLHTYYIYVTTSKRVQNQDHDALLPKPSFYRCTESIRRLVLPRFLSTLSFSNSGDWYNGGRSKTTRTEAIINLPRLVAASVAHAVAAAVAQPVLLVRRRVAVVHGLDLHGTAAGVRLLHGSEDDLVRRLAARLVEGLRSG
jgi:hypothetical protein